MTYWERYLSSWLSPCPAPVELQLYLIQHLIPITRINKTSNNILNKKAHLKIFSGDSSFVSVR
jgi:hypothetical protein